MDSIVIKDLCFAYDDKTIYDHYSTSFPAGEMSVIASPSGTGKTTLLHLIAGLLKIDSGSISIPVENPRYSMVFQDLRLIENISVEQNIRLINDKVSLNDVSTILNELGISGYEHKKVKSLSGGEKQRVAIARALLAEYDILLLDEPFSWLDKDAENKARLAIEKYRAGRIAIVVGH